MFHILLQCEFHSLFLCHAGTSMHLFPPPPGYWYTAFFFLACPSHLHESTASAFTRSPLGLANTFSFIFLASIPRISPSVFLILPCFVALAFPFFLSFLLILPCTTQTSRRTSPLLGFPLYPSILSQLRYPTLWRPFVTFSHTALSTMAGNLFFAYSLLSIAVSTFLISQFVWSECVPSSALTTVLLLIVVLEHLRIFLAAVI